MLGFFGHKQFRNPDFSVISTPKGLLFYPTGWGNSYQEALDDAKRGAWELHEKLQKKYNLTLGFRFDEESPSKKRTPHPVLQYAGPPVPPQSATEAMTPSPAVTIKGTTYQVAGGALVINGKPFYPDHSDPDGAEGVGPGDGQTLTVAKRDLESIPQSIDDAVAAQLQPIVAQFQVAVKDAVAQALKEAGASMFKDVGAALASTIKDAMVAGIQQGLAQANAPPASQQQQGKPPNGQYT
jgi:hypothetical protein